MSMQGVYMTWAVMSILIGRIKWIGGRISSAANHFGMLGLTFSEEVLRASSTRRTTR